MTKQEGQSAHEYFYTPFGGIVDDNGHPEDSSNWTDPHNHYLLTGKEWDEEMGLYYFGARYYDAATGVWLTQDVYRGQVEQPLTLHRTLYVEANPVNNVDAYGYAVIANGTGGSGGGSTPVSPQQPTPSNPARPDNHPYEWKPDRGGGRSVSGGDGGGRDESEDELGYISWVAQPTILDPQALPSSQIGAFIYSTQAGLPSLEDRRYYDPDNPNPMLYCQTEEECQEAERQLYTTLGVAGAVSIAIPLGVAAAPAAMAYGEQLLYQGFAWSLSHPLETVLAYNVAETAAECSGGGCTPESAAFSVVFGAFVDYPQGFVGGASLGAGVDPEDILLREALLGDADEAITFYHGFAPEHLADYDEGGRIMAYGSEDVHDFGKAFYATRRESEAIDWATMRTRAGEERYVVGIEAYRGQLDTLVGRELTPFEYRLGVPRDEYIQGVRATQEEIQVIRSSADYFYGPVTDLPGWEQYAFKTEQSLNVLNASPRLLYRVSPESNLELIRRIMPQ